jgi:hypothetical protein
MVLDKYLPRPVGAGFKPALTRDWTNYIRDLDLLLGTSMQAKVYDFERASFATGRGGFQTRPYAGWETSHLKF